VRHLLALSGSVVSIRHWFEINLDDASMEHGARIEIRRLRDETADVSGITVYMQPVQDLTLDNTISRTQYQFTLESADSAALSSWTPKLVNALAQLPQLSDVVSNQEDNGLAAYVTIDRDSAARLGISVGTVDNALYDAFGQRIVSTIFTQSNQYRVIMEADPKAYRSVDDLASIYVPSATGGQVPLSAIAKVDVETRPILINHLAQFPATTVSFNLAPNAALGNAITAINKVQKDMHMPPSLQAGFQGTAASFTNSLANEPLLILAALVTVYIVLGVLYESFVHPITILSTLPSAGVGAFLALILFHQDLSVVAIIGIVLLIGIVKKNGIMMVDFALEAERKGGKNSTDAIYEACLLRFRPIMMTTMAALLAGLPLALGTGFGSELRRPLGIAMVGGLLLSQALTLYTTPVIYIFFDRLSQRFAPKSAEPDGDGAPVAPA